MLADWALTDPDFWLALTPLWPLVGYMLRFCPCCQEPFCADGTFSDAEMADAGWTFGSVTYGGENENTYEIEQITDDGRPPPCREITVEHGASELDETSGIVVYNLLNSAVYDPSDREIDRMDFSIRIRAISTDNPQGGLLPVFAVISQGGTLYRTETLGFITSFPSQWMLVEAEGLTSDDFFEIVDDDETGLDEDSHPDWSTEGASMTFGFGTYQEGLGLNELTFCPPVNCNWLNPGPCLLIYPDKDSYDAQNYIYGPNIRMVAARNTLDNSCLYVVNTAIGVSGGVNPLTYTGTLVYYNGSNWIMRTANSTWEGEGPAEYTNPCGYYSQTFSTRGNATGYLDSSEICRFHCGIIVTSLNQVTHRGSASGGSEGAVVGLNVPCTCCAGLFLPTSELQAGRGVSTPWGCCIAGGLPTGIGPLPRAPQCSYRNYVLQGLPPVPPCHAESSTVSPTFSCVSSIPFAPHPTVTSWSGTSPGAGSTTYQGMPPGDFYRVTVPSAGFEEGIAPGMRLFYYAPRNFPVANGDTLVIDTPSGSFESLPGGQGASGGDAFAQRARCTGFSFSFTSVYTPPQPSCPRTPPPGHEECITQQLAEHHTTVGRFDQLCIKLHLACDGDIFDSQMESANYIGGSVRYGTTNTNSVERSHKEDEGHPAPCMQLDLLIGSSEGLDGIQAYQLRSSATFDPSLHHGLGSVAFEIAAKGISSGVSGVSSLPVFATLSQGGKFYRTAPLGTISVPGPWTVITAESLTEDDFFEMSSSEADGMIQNSHPDWRMSGGMMTFGFGTAQETSGASGHVIAQFDALCLSFTEYDSVAPAACPCYQFSLSASIDTDPVPLPPFFPQPPPSCPDGWCCAAPSSSWTFTQIASNPCYYCSQAESLSCRCGAVTTGLTNNCGDGQRQWVLVISPTIATPPFTGQIAYVRNLPGAGFLEYRCANFDWNADSNTFDRISDLVGCDSSALPSQLTLTCTNRG